MGVSEENIDKIQAAGISNSQQYKLAGNSIVIDVPECNGGTICDKCPFMIGDYVCFKATSKVCDKVDFSRMIVEKLKESK